MRWVALRFAYDGTAFPCYARNPDQPESVEQRLIDALGPHGFRPGTFRTGSRTDAGVSALGNVCRAGLERDHLDGLLAGLQSDLADGMWVTGVATVEEAWNPRHATARTYSYTAWPAGSMEAARQACRRFVGTHDMRAFARMEEGRSPTRTVTAFDVHADGPLWEYRVQGASFLWNQVRRMVGAAEAVASGKAAPEHIDEALQTGIPHGAFTTAPPEGLLLEEAHYEGLAWTVPEARPSRRVRAQTVAAHVRTRVHRHAQNAHGVEGAL